MDYSKVICTQNIISSLDIPVESDVKEVCKSLNHFRQFRYVIQDEKSPCNFCHLFIRGDNDFDDE